MSTSVDTARPLPPPAGPKTRPRRLRWLLPALLVIGWLVIGAVGSPYQGKLSEVLEDSNAAFLPKSAEATKVNDIVQKFAERNDIDALIVYDRASGITAADRDYLTAKAAEFGRFHDEDLARAGGLDGRISPVVPSKDGKAAQIVILLPDSLDQKVGDVTKKLREVASAGLPAGLTMHLTGGAGISADFSDAFGDLDGLLLWVTIGVVVGILMLIYRSPLLPLVVLLSGGFALITASTAVYFLTKAGVVTLNGQSQGILMVLVLGAATDYALLLVSRYREELRRHTSKYDAMRVSWRACVEPLVASAGTVIIGLLCLLLSDLNSNKSLGPVAAVGIAASLLTALTFLPAMLVLLGRGAFWPFRPKEGTDQPKGVWGRVANVVGRRPRMVGAGTAVILLGCLAFLPQFKADGLQFSDSFTTKTEAVRGMEVFAEHFPAGSGSPSIIITKPERANTVADVARTVPGVSSVEVKPKVVDGVQMVDATLADDPSSKAAQATVERLRTAVRAVPGADAQVGGSSAAWLDIHTTSVRDLQVIIPVVLIVILLVLSLLLRSLVAPLLLTLTVGISYAATLGVGALVFNNVFHFANSDPSLPMLSFVFLVALGIDYNIFLMTRVREEALKDGTRRGTLTGLSVTGGVITSAGVILAATFGALALMPLVFLVQMAFMVAFGVLLDTLIVRSLLVPALTLQIGRKIWWPGALSRGKP
jgi:putative drug exporter of the RND superfamily